MKLQLQIAILIAVALLSGATRARAQQLEAKPRQVDFRCVLVGERPMIQVEIENTGTFAAARVDVGLANVGSPFSLMGSLTFPMAPREKRIIGVNFIPKLAGQYSNTIVVRYGALRLDIPIQGMASQPPHLQAELGRGVIAFGPLPLGDTLRDTVTIGVLSCRELVVDTLGLKGSPDFRLLQTIPLPDTFESDAGRRRLVRVSYSPTKVGPAIATLRYRGRFQGPAGDFQFTDSVLVLTGAGVRPNLFAKPDTLEFGSVSINAIGAPQLVVVANPGNFNAAIDDIAIIGPDSLEFLLQPIGLPLFIGGKRRDGGIADTIQLRAAMAPRRAGDLRAAIRISSPDGDTLLIPMHGTAISPPRLEVRPRNIDFGNVATGFTRKLVDTIVVHYLDGTDADVTFDQISIGGNDPAAFSVAPLGPVTIRRGDSALFTLSFSPTALQRYNGRVFFGISKGETLTADLVGRGIPPAIIVVPRTIDFGPVTLNSVSPSRRVGVVNLGPNPVDVDPIELFGPDASEFIFSPPGPIRLRPRGQDTGFITLEMAPVGVIGPRSAGLRLVHIGVDTVDLKGLAVNDGAIARPRRINMGRVPVGLRRTIRDTIQIRYVSGTNATTTIDSIRWQGVDARNFSITGPLPATIGGTDSALFDVSFTPDGQRYFVARALFILGNGVRLPVVIEGDGVGSEIIALPTSLSFPATERNRTSPPETTAVINLAIVARTIDSVRIIPGAAAEFLIDTLPMVAATLDPSGIGGSDTTRIAVRFRPTTDGVRTGTLRIYHDATATLDVPLNGLGIAPPVVTNPATQYLVALDTIYTDVNQFRMMSATVDPPILPLDSITTFRALLHYNPEAIYVTPTTPSTAGDPVMRQISPDTLEISGTAPTGSRLFRFEFRGLVSGKPENVIELLSLDLGGADTIPALRNGFVVLAGCDIAHPTLFGRPARAWSISPNPVTTSSVELRYEAPAGSLPRLRIVALDGTERGTLQLPEATGAQQTAPIDLTELRSGLYFLELRLGTQRSSLPVLIGR